MNICLKKSASIHPRTSPPRFGCTCHEFCKTTNTPDLEPGLRPYSTTSMATALLNNSIGPSGMNPSFHALKCRQPRHALSTESSRSLLRLVLTTNDDLYVGGFESSFHTCQICAACGRSPSPNRFNLKKASVHESCCVQVSTYVD